MTNICAVFKDSDADALAAAHGISFTTTGTDMPPMVFLINSPGTSPVTFKLRMGSVGIFYVNADAGGTQLFDGVSQTTMTIEEIKQ